MSAHPLRARDYLGHMLDSVRQILQYTANRGATDFESDRLIQDAVVRNIEILGDASKRFVEAVPNASVRFPTIPFAAIYAMRNQLSHGYFSVDLEIVWKVVERDIPQLLPELERALAEIDRQPAP